MDVAIWLALQRCEFESCLFYNDGYSSIVTNQINKQKIGNRKQNKTRLHLYTNTKTQTQTNNFNVHNLKFKFSCHTSLVPLEVL